MYIIAVMKNGEERNISNGYMHGDATGDFK